MTEKTGGRKPFDQELHDENDQACRVIAKMWLAFRGIKAVDGSRLEADLYIPDHVTWLELQRSQIWKGEPFPHKVVWMAERKRDHRRKHKKVNYWVFSHDYTQALSFSFERDFKEEWLIESGEIFGGKKELVFAVPLEEFKLVIIWDDLMWRTIFPTRQGRPDGAWKEEERNDKADTD